MSVQRREAGRLADTECRVVDAISVATRTAARHRKVQQHGRPLRVARAEAERFQKMLDGTFRLSRYDLDKGKSRQRHHRVGVELVAPLSAGQGLVDAIAVGGESQQESLH